MRASALASLALLTLAVGCGREALPLPAQAPQTAPPSPSACGGPLMTVRFYDVGQALAALVVLPDGRRVLVDTGEDPKRAGCGPACAAWSEALLSKLEADVPDRRLDAVWVTHQHADHVGNAAAILTRFDVSLYVDNGSLEDARLVALARDAARARGTRVASVDPEHPASPLAGSEGVTIRAVVPTRWPKRCDTSRNQNDCSVGLRVDYCASSVLFTGDAGAPEEKGLDPGGVATVLQVGHHGSKTSSTGAFLANVRPTWAVISVAAKDEGTNRQYCLPNGATVAALSDALGDRRGASVTAFDGTCKGEGSAGWSEVPASERLFVTARDGDVVLTTRGDGRFERAR